MVNKIICVADIHIRNVRRFDEYTEKLTQFINDCKDIVEKNGAENTRIVIAGDLLHNKLEISGEGYSLASWFLRSLDNICKTIVIAGNHDMNMNNLVRIDPISAIFSMCDFKQVYYLDKELEYNSGCIVDDNIVWSLYSSFSSFAKPNIDETKITYPDDEYTYVGLYHGSVKNAKTDAGYISSNGLDISYFDGCSTVIMGHIHKRQTMNYEGMKLHYCGSIIQQDHGENISNHGYSIYDVEDDTYNEVSYDDNQYAFYTMEINDITDIEQDKEEILNL